MNHVDQGSRKGYRIDVVIVASESVGRRVTVAASCGRSTAAAGFRGQIPVGLRLPQLDLLAQFVQFSLAGFAGGANLKISLFFYF